MRARVGLLVVALVVPLGSFWPARAATVDIAVSNFRFCRRAPCQAWEFVYVRNPTGNGLFHKNALAATLVFRTAVRPGDRVVWTYRDTFCDRIQGCPGHAVCFENGTPEGACGSRRLPARSGPVTVSFTVPSTARPGTLIRYFCNVNAHYVFGMTGTLLVR
jgi:plastocyanin